MSNYDYDLGNYYADTDAPTIADAVAALPESDVRELLLSILEDVGSKEGDADYRDWIRKIGEDTLANHVWNMNEEDEVRREQEADYAQEKRSQINAMNRRLA